MAKLIHTHKGTVYAQRNGVLIPVNTDGLVGYWPMTQGSGLTLYDESKNGNDGTLNNGPVWTNTANGKALDFDGVDDYVDTNSTFQATFRNSFTIEAWIKPNDGQGSKSRFMGYINPSEEDKLQFFIMSTGHLRSRFTSNGNLGDAYTDSPVFSDGQETWHHVVWVAVADTQAYLYLDGVLQSLDPSVDGDYSGLTFADFTTNETLFAGGVVISGSLYKSFDGKIDEVRIYDRALSAQEITNIYEKTRGLYNV